MKNGGRGTPVFRGSAPQNGGGGKQKPVKGSEFRRKAAFRSAERRKSRAKFLTEFDPASSFQISDFPWRFRGFAESGYGLVEFSNS